MDGLTFKLVVSGLIAVAAFLAITGVKRSLGGLKKKLPKADVGKIGSWARLAILVLAALVILNLFDMQLTALITVIGTICGVIAIGFVATWSTLANFPCTFYLILMKPFSVGDDLEIMADGIRGKVVDITLAYTVLQDGEGYHVNIPNMQFMQKQFRRKSGNVSIPLSEQLRKSDPVKVATPVKPIDPNSAATPPAPPTPDPAVHQPGGSSPQSAASIAATPVSEKKAILPVTKSDQRRAEELPKPPEEKKFKVT